MIKATETCEAQTPKNAKLQIIVTRLDAKGEETNLIANRLYSLICRLYGEFPVSGLEHTTQDGHMIGSINGRIDRIERDTNAILQMLDRLEEVI